MPQEHTPVELAGQGGSVVLSLLGGLCLFVLVLAAAWLCTRWLGGYYRRGGGENGTIRVLERTAVGPDRTLMVVRTGARVWLIGVTPHHISPIGELDPGDYPEEVRTPAAAAGKEFSTALQSALQGWTGKRQGQEDGKEQDG